MTTLPAGLIVADASFLIAVAERDPDAARFVAVLDRCEVTAVNFGEVCYKLHQKSGMSAERTTHVFTQVLKVAVKPVELNHARCFPDLKTIDAASRAAQQATGVTVIKSLSLADITCLAFAMCAGNAPVLTGDKHWTTLGPHGLRVAAYDFRDPNLTL